ncbi:hypothetical protein XBJ2_60011 [Xenorhabdus bovienii str. Jollieti]|uniref:Uncharacterized protein n=1 Tax=Xenorhabdus bovienii (strain SS-2004) TaxID=406818 RepID=D3UYD3_XENBS|nr:hypothetical protein XBJ1_0160 [Xenorhabdus bovienii SS-2004]CDH30155.1 hypothetical protein XBJ2_60011 [Xenorhabdus bovienii str. Jollieti]
MATVEVKCRFCNQTKAVKKYGKGKGVTSVIVAFPVIALSNWIILIAPAMPG